MKDEELRKKDNCKVMTNHLGMPIYDDDNSLTISDRGKTLLEDTQLIDKLAHFDRERIPERVVHATLI